MSEMILYVRDLELELGKEPRGVELARIEVRLHVFIMAISRCINIWD